MTQIKLYKLFSLDNSKTYYGLTKLKLNLCLNLLTSYYNNKRNLAHPYYEIIKAPHDITVVEEFDDRLLAKERLTKITTEDTNCINSKVTIVNDVQVPVAKPRVKKTDNPEYNKQYYLENKERIKNYYQKNLHKCREYNKQRYLMTKEKLQKLKELESKKE